MDGKQIRNSQLATRNFTTSPELGTPILRHYANGWKGRRKLLRKWGRWQPNQNGTAKNPGSYQSEKGKPKNQLFTRGLEMLPPCSPTWFLPFHDLRFTIYDLRSGILDGEVVAFDSKTNKILPFQTMITPEKKI